MTHRPSVSGETDSKVKEELNNVANPELGAVPGEETTLYEIVVKHPRFMSSIQLSNSASLIELVSCKQTISGRKQLSHANNVSRLESDRNPWQFKVIILTVLTAIAYDKKRQIKCVFITEQQRD
jgi:hypothetical protein